MYSTFKQFYQTIYSGLSVIFGIILLNGIVVWLNGIDLFSELFPLRCTIFALISLVLFRFFTEKLSGDISDNRVLWMFIAISIALASDKL
jgi:hypothetical protein